MNKPKLEVCFADCDLPTEFVLRELLDMGYPIGDVLVRMRLLVVQSCVRHWKAHVKGEKVEDVWESAGFPPMTENESWAYWHTCMDGGLRLFTPHIVIDDVGDFPPVDLVDRCFLQLADLTTLNPTSFLVCKNERCRIEFLFQRSKSHNGRGSHRSGVEFCSTECNNRQSSRDKRARDRVERAERAATPERQSKVTTRRS